MTSRQPDRSTVIERCAPGLDRLRHYRRDWLPVDALAGLTVGAMLVPQGMADAELAGMPTGCCSSPTPIATASVWSCCSRRTGEEEWLVLDFEGVGEADTTALDMLDERFDEQRRAGRVVAIARANDRVMRRLHRAGLLQPTGIALVFPTINAAVRAFEHRPIG